VQQVKHNGAALTESHTRTLQVKGLKMRMESRRGSETYTYIYDLEAGKRYRLVPKHKEVFVAELAAQRIRRRVACKASAKVYQTDGQES